MRKKNKKTYTSKVNTSYPKKKIKEWGVCLVKTQVRKVN